MNSKEMEMTKTEESVLLILAEEMGLAVADSFVIIDPTNAEPAPKTENLIREKTYSLLT
ncbi:MAG: hypothetical protein LHV69_08635 [Elusimicrobia bacterium]|nr:hypothetical protein [Candidatus Obscuribacterium magneticum]